MNPSTAARHRRRRRAGDAADRHRGDHVAQACARPAAPRPTPARAADRRRRRARTIAVAADREPSSTRRDARTATGAPRRRSAPSHARPGRPRSRPPSRPASGSRRRAPSPPRTPRPSDGDRDGRARSSAAPRSTGGTSSVVSSWKLLASTTCTVSGVDVVDLRAERHADVAADQHLTPAGLEHPPRQRRRRRLALRAGDRDHASAAASATRARASPMIGDAARARGRVDDRLLERHARARARPDRRREASSGRCPPSSSATPAVAQPVLRRRSPARFAQRHRAPRRTSSSAAATPLRAAPTTITRCPCDARTAACRRSPQLQRRQAEEREDDRDDQEARDDLRLAPADQLEVMVQRRHLEDALAA